MADGFHTKDIVKSSNLLSVFVKENYSKESYKHKIENLYFMNIHI